MTKIEIFKTIMTKAKYGGYTGPDYKYKSGFIVDDTNIYSLIFREDFAKALWGEEESILEGIPTWRNELKLLVDAENKWKYLEENVL